MLRALTIQFLFLSYYLGAQNPTFYAQVSKTKVAVGEVFQIAFTVNAAGGNISLPAIEKDFDVYSGPNQSQSMSMVNGNVSQSTSISFMIAARKEGKFTIGSAKIQSGNQKLETTPIAIEVVKGTTQAQSGGGNQQNGNTASGSKNQAAQEVGSDELFVKTLLSKTKCYIGEQITITQKVYSRVDLRGFQNVKFPPYNGFWSQQEEGTKQINLQQENVNGVMYYVAEYNKVYLFPQRTGNLTVDPIELECIVRKQSKRQPRNIFEQFFGAGSYEDVLVKVKSKTVKVEVIDLPTENKPADFTGAVGDFSYKAQLSKQQVKANEAVNLKLTISGQGNIKLVEPLKSNLPESFESYDPKINENISTVKGVSGSKTYDYIIIPREKGEFVINNLVFSYFDTDKKKYVTLPSPDINLTVLEGDNTSAQIITPTKKDVKATENDIRYIKTGDLELQKKDEEFFASYKHYLLLIFPTLLFAGVLMIAKQHIKTNSNSVAVKERKAAKMAKKQLVIAEQHMSNNNKDLFFNEVLNALHKYIGDKFALSIADFSKDKIAGMLLSKNVTQQTTTKVLEILSTCEFAKYAPSTVTSNLKEVYNNTLELISQIEEQIKIR